MNNFRDLVGLNTVDPERVELLVTPSLLNRQGRIHGGALATLLDVAMGTGARAAVPDSSGVLTVQLQVYYDDPAVEGDLLIATPAVARRGGRIVMTTAEIRRQSDHKLIAHGSAVFSVRWDGGGGGQLEND